MSFIVRHDLSSILILHLSLNIQHSTRTTFRRPGCSSTSCHQLDQIEVKIIINFQKKTKLRVGCLAKLLSAQFTICFFFFFLFSHIFRDPPRKRRTVYVVQLMTHWHGMSAGWAVRIYYIYLITICTY